MKNSAISIEDNRLSVKLSMKGKMVLEARGFEKILSSKLADLYHKNYVVSYQEEITQEMIEQYQAHARELEKQAIMLAQKEAMEQAEEKRQEKEKKIEIFFDKNGIKHKQADDPYSNLTNNIVYQEVNGNKYITFNNISFYSYWYKNYDRTDDICKIKLVEAYKYK